MLQAAAIPDMLQGGDILLASHTGSGKTLAYLLPLVWNQRNHPFWAGSRNTCIMLCCCAIACFHSCHHLPSLLLLYDAACCVHCRCTSCGNKSRMASRPSRDVPEHWFWVPPGSSLTRSCRLPSHSVTMPASDQHASMEVMFCHFSIPCICWRLAMAWDYFTMEQPSLMSSKHSHGLHGSMHRSPSKIESH